MISLRRSWRSRNWWLALSLIAWLVGAPAAWGHATGESYVWLNVETSHLEGRFEIRITDLQTDLGINIPDDPAAERQAILDSAAQVQTYLRDNFSMSAEGQPLAYEFTTTDVTVEADGLGSFAQYFFRTPEMTVPEQIDIRNTVLLEKDRFHRTLLCIEYDKQRNKQYGEEFTAMVFASHTSEQTLDLANIEGLLRVRDFVWQGVLHIWIGIDHVLFLIALLLTAVLVRKDDQWQPVDDFKTAFWKIVGIVTAFTVAHSITLALAALDIFNLPSRFVESIIALSIVLVAINNIKPKFHDKSWLLIFFFGLFHGMGFASVMGELPFRMMHLTQIILAFNIGVELGQLAIVFAVFPIIFLLRKHSLYQPVVLIGGSVAVGLIAAWWFLERALGWG